MENQVFIEQMKKYYESLNHFYYFENSLVLNDGQTQYVLPINNTYLSSLNQNIFLLNPIEIYEIIRMIELLYKETLSDDDIKFIETYTSKYNNLNTQHVESNNIDENLLYCLGIPIYLSYNFENNPCAKIIINELNNYTEKVESSKGKHPKLILTNPQFSQFQEENYIDNFEKAGFTTLSLIVIAIVSTCIYMMYFLTK